MNTDFRIAVDFFDDNNRKARNLVAAMGDAGVVSLFRLWRYTAKFHPTGVLRGVSPQEMETAAKWSGTAGEFASYLRKHRWIERGSRSEDFRIHNWEKHNAWAADVEHRTQKARKNAHTRHHKNEPRPDKCEFCAEDALKNPALASSNAGSNTVSNAGSNAPATSNAPSPSPSPSPAPRSKATPRTSRAREAADAWNAMIGTFGDRPAVAEAEIDSIADVAESITDDAIKLRFDFTWLECLSRIERGSWLLTRPWFGFAWLFKREQHGHELNVVKLWDRRLGGPEGGRQFDREGDEPVFDDKGFARRVVE